jgi:two-component system nitrogen regulation sensor histidine kinase NtrY
MATRKYLALAGKAMRFRRRLLLLFALTVVVSVAAVALIVSAMARRAFDRANDERTAALVAQFRREFNRRGDEVARRIQAVAAAPETSRIAVAAAKPTPDYSVFLEDAQVVAEAQRLDFLEFADDRGTIISSAQWPAKFGYKEPLARANVPTTAFLKEEETPEGSALGLFFVRTMPDADHVLYIIGGIRLDRSFLESLDLPTGMRVMLYENLNSGSEKFAPEHLISASGSAEDALALAPLIREVQFREKDATAIITAANAADEETVNAIPLTGENKQLLGILLVGSSRRPYAELRNQIRSAALLAAGTGLLLAVLLSSWAAARVTRPVERLAHAAHEVAEGNWNTRVETSSSDEIGELADAFNRMTHELLDQQERLVQSERVAAWRELARRLAHELKNPLFPLQLTVENLLRAREQGQQQFDETFRESATTLLTEISHLKNIIGRFSEFSKMPQPNFQSVDLNELLKEVVKLHQAQFVGAKIEVQLQLPRLLRDPDVRNPKTLVAADPDLLHRALSNLILNAIDAMPAGGTLTLSTGVEQHSARITVSDTGKGMAPEECERLFTPYYTSKLGGTGLGLAIVQSIVSDHGGRISLTSEPGKGTTFIIELPANLDKLPAAHGTHV